MGLQQDEAQVWVEQGKQQLQWSLWSIALQSFERAISIDEDCLAAWERKAEALRQLGQWNKTVVVNEKITSLRMLEVTLDADFYFDQGNTFYQLAAYEEAIVYYNKAITIKPNCYEAWYNRGNSMSALGRKEEAITSYDRALEIKPNCHEAWYHRGNSIAALGRREEAINSYDEAIKIKPDYHEAWFKRGVLLSALGRKEEAINSYGKATEIKPNYHEALFNCGVLLAILGRKEEAINSYDRAIKIKPDYHEAWSNRGDVLSELDRKEEAIKSYDSVIEFKPDNHKAWFKRGNMMDDLGRQQGAIASYDKAIEIKPDYHEAWYNRSVAAEFYRAQTPFSLLIFLNQQPANLQLKHPELEQRGYAGQLACLTVGLTYCPANIHPLGHGFLNRKLGDAYNNHAKFERFPRPDYFKAIKAYQTALTVLTEPDHLEERLLTFQSLIHTYLSLKDIPNALHYQTQGSQLYETLRTQAQNKRTFEAKFSTFRLAEIDLLIGKNEPARALEQAEFYKNRALTWLFDNDQEITLSPTYDRIRSHLTPETAIVYWHQSTDRITTFILTNDNAEPIVLDCDRQQQYKRFIVWKDKWDKDYDDYRSKKSATQLDHPWRQQMRDRLKQLAEILEIDAIEHHLKNTETLILIPHRDLHRYPIHALFDRPTTHAPSLQSIDRASHPAHADHPSLLTIADPETPTDPMPYALLESALLQTLVRASHPAPLLSIISPEAANLPTTLQSLKNPNHTHFHFTGHGIHNSQFPNRSALQLKNGLLTASTISQLDLNHQHLAILAACETAIVTTDDTSDYIGIQSAFLRAGTRTILSTLWNIDEIASTWFIIHFYQQILNGETASIALRTTQTWMQTLTWEELDQWITDLSQIENLTYRWKKELCQSIEDIQKEQGKMNEIRTPYANPYYWAAFALVGAA